MALNLDDKTKKIMLWVIMGTIILISVAGTFVPSARDYIVKVIGIISAFIPTIIN